MRAITLRNVPPEVEQAILKKAATEGSLNRAVIKLLEESIGAKQNGKPRKYRDLSRFAGTWTKREFDSFNKALAEIRQIHPDDWKQ